MRLGSSRRNVRLVLAVALAVAAVSCSPSAPPTFTVEGRVVGLGFLATAGIVVQAQGRTTVTDGQGRFTLTGIARPYDLTLAETGANAWIHVYEGLTSEAPQLDPQRPIVLGSISQAYVIGALAGGALPAGRRTLVCAEGRDAVAFGCDTVGEGEDAYGFDVRWLRPGPAVVRLHALRTVVGPSGLPTGYEGYGYVQPTLNDGDSANAPITLGPAPATVVAAVGLDLPSGATVAYAFVLARIGDRVAVRLAGPAPVAGSFSLPVPRLGPEEVTAFASVSTSTTFSFAWAQGAADDLAPLAVGVAPQMLLPADGAVGVGTATVFRVAAPADEAITFVWEVAGGPTLARTTRRTEVTVPEGVDLGVVVPAGAALKWNAWGHGPVAVEAAGAFTNIRALELIFDGLHVELPERGAIARSPSERTATWAP
jgi:hypothetical protein